MKAITMLAAAGVLLLSMSVDAQNAQQEKMKTCNAQAKEQTLSGAARKSCGPADETMIVGTFPRYPLRTPHDHEPEPSSPPRGLCRFRNRSPLLVRANTPTRSLTIEATYDL